jgi:hypothetical protein
MKLPQLSLRDLFWLVLIVALGLGWWQDHSQQHFQNFVWQARCEHLEVLLNKTRFAEEKQAEAARLFRNGQVPGRPVRTGQRTGVIEEQP